MIEIIQNTLLILLFIFSFWIFLSILWSKEKNPTMTDVHKEFITLDKQREHKKEGKKILANFITTSKDTLRIIDEMKKVLDEENNQW